MNMLKRVGAIVIAVLTLLAAANGVSGSTTDPLVGKTYKEAAAKISGWGNTPKIETVTGGLLETDDCIVSSWRKSNFLDLGGVQRKTFAILVNINCNNAVALPGTPGNSAMTPEGKAELLNIKYGKWCSKPAQSENDACARWCAKDETSQYCSL